MMWNEDDEDGHRIEIENCRHHFAEICGFVIVSGNKFVWQNSNERNIKIHESKAFYIDVTAVRTINMNIFGYFGVHCKFDLRDIVIFISYRWECVTALI